MKNEISISDFRKNIAYYLEKAAKGDKLLIKDAKKSKYIAQITNIKTFDKNEYEESLKLASGVLSNKHGEWKTKESISSWLKESRTQADRGF